MSPHTPLLLQPACSLCVLVSHLHLSNIRRDVEQLLFMTRILDSSVADIYCMDIALRKASAKGFESFGARKLHHPDVEMVAPMLRYDSANKCCGLEGIRMRRPIWSRTCSLTPSTLVLCGTPHRGSGPIGEVEETNPVSILLDRQGSG